MLIFVWTLFLLSQQNTRQNIEHLKRILRIFLKSFPSNEN
jgi:hypothetical protein